MKKLWILFLVAGFTLACNNDKNGKGNDKSAIDNREKDDYRKTGNTDTKTSPDEKHEKTGNDSKNNGTDESHDGWGDANKGGSWTDNDRTQFMNDCERTASKKVGAARANEYCDCMLQKVMKRYSNYSEANLKLAEPGSSSMVNAMVADCNRQ